MQSWLGSASALLMGLIVFAHRVCSLLYLGLSPLPVTVTTRIITFLVGDPYKPSFATVIGRGDNPSYIKHWPVLKKQTDGFL